ncbi:MAG: hypothetical protein GY757_09640 [bacterium]|nr:hypothetical protein [bacterium]
MSFWLEQISLQLDSMSNKRGPCITNLVNGYYLGLDYMFILFDAGKTQLVSMGFDQTPDIQNFSDYGKLEKKVREIIRECCKSNGLGFSLPPMWSALYKPDKNWLEQRLAGVPILSLEELLPDNEISSYGVDDVLLDKSRYMDVMSKPPTDGSNIWWNQIQ